MSHRFVNGKIYDKNVIEELDFTELIVYIYIVAKLVISTRNNNYNNTDRKDILLGYIKREWEGCIIYTSRDIF